MNTIAMDPRKLFFDNRLTGFCVYCGNKPETRDHVPSRVLLDEPFPSNLPVVECCQQCNVGFSLDEQYLACFIECVLAGTTSLQHISRSKIARLLSENQSIASRIAASMTVNASGVKVWQPEEERVHNVILKLARGHIAYELGLPRLETPISIRCLPLILLQKDEIENFLSPQKTPFFPEIGSRAFMRVTDFQVPRYDEWQIVQPGKYQYLVSQANGDFVRILISNYLACEVCWD